MGMIPSQYISVKIGETTVITRSLNGKYRQQTAFRIFTLIVTLNLVLQLTFVGVCENCRHNVCGLALHLRMSCSRILCEFYMD